MTTGDRAPSTIASLIRLARPKQWAKSAFVLVGPLYGFADKLNAEPPATPESIIVPALVTAAVFSLASSTATPTASIHARRTAQSPPASSPSTPREPSQ